MLQNKLLTFYFELKLQVRKMENISLSEIFRLLATPIMGRIRASSQPCGRWSCQWACGFRLVHVSLLFRSGNGQVRMLG